MPSNGKAEDGAVRLPVDLLDYMAGQALQGFIANGFVGHITGLSEDGGLGASNADAEALIAQASYRFGRAMLAERQKARPQ